MSNGVGNIELKLTPTRELFYNDDFGVYACKSDNNTLTLTKFGTFVINGQMQKLCLDQEYEAVIKETFHKKYGKGYEVLSIRQQTPQTQEEKHRFLKMVLTEHQATLLINALPDEDIIEQIKNDALDYKKIKGIGKATYEKIREAVLENITIQEALSELSQYGVTYRIVKKLLQRYNNSSELLIQKINENPYMLCKEVSGLGFKKVDTYAIKMGVPVDSSFRIEAGVRHVLKQEESNGHCWIKIDDMLTKLFNLLGLDKQLLQNFINKDKNIGEIYIGEKRIGFMKYYKQEEKISEKLKELLSSETNFAVKDIDKKISEIEKKMNIAYTKEQREAIYKAVDNNVIIITGKAGTGKTSVLRGIMHVLNKYTYGTCALSGKASQRIIESTGLKSATIHRLLGFIPRQGFTFTEDNPLPEQIIVLDEGSMVDIPLFYHLVKAIKHGSKLIILGDTEQLPAIGAGLLLKDMIESGKIPVVELTQVHRQALKSGILLAANQVRDGKQITDRKETSGKVIGELKDLYIIPKEKDDIFEYVKNACMKIKDRVDIREFQVIAPIKKGETGTKNLNITLQKIFNPSDGDAIKRNGYEYKVGDKVIKSGNDYEKNLYNGTIGFVSKINVEDNIMGIQFVDRDYVVDYTGEELDSIDMAYALTTHRLQGAESEHVIFVFDYSSYKLLNRQMIYTALTRASKKCVMVCENKALRYAISNNDSGGRNTWLKEMLLDNVGDQMKSGGGEYLEDTGDWDTIGWLDG